MQIVSLSVLSCLLLASAGCCTTKESAAPDACGAVAKCGDMTAEKIVAETEKAFVPGIKQQDLISAQMTMTVSGDKEDVDGAEQISITCKNPDKIRFMTRFPDKYLVKGWDGKTGWEYSSVTGYRLLQGAELDEIRFQGAYLAPGMRIYHVFPEVKLQGTAEVAGHNCWKLLMIPDKKFNSQNLIFYVDQKTYLLVKSEEYVDATSAAVQVETVFSDYKDIGGVMVSETMVNEVDGKIVEMKVSSMEWNVPVDDMFFSPPVSLNAKK